MFVTGALCALHRLRSHVQRYLNAKSFCYYANDAYSPYEVLHVIGISQDYFLSSKDRKWGNERGRDREKESRKKNEEMRRALLEHEEQEVAHSAFIVLCFRENIFLIFEEFSEKG